MILRRTLVLALALVGCDAPVPAPVDDAPRDLRVRGPEAGDVELLSSARADTVLALSDRGLLLAGGSQLSVVRPDGSVDDLGSEPGALRAVARFGDAAVLAGERGVFTLDEAGLRRSPLDDALADALVVDITAGGDSLWIATTDRLLRWHDGILSSVEAEGLPPSNAALSAAVIEGGDGVWVAAGGSLYAVVAADGSLSAHLEADVSPDSMATDASGSLWCAEGTSLLRRRPDGHWDSWIAPSRVRAIAARPERSEVWLQTDDGLIVFDAVDFRGLDSTVEGKLVDVDGVGRAILLDRDVGRVSVDRPILVLGGPRGSLEAPEVVQFMPTRPDLVSGITVSLDDSPAEALPSSWAVALDPIEFDEGPHRLDVSVEYSDREGATGSSLAFGVGAFEVPTWSSGIEAIHDYSCGECHDPGGSARLLSTSAQWQADIDDVLDNVTQQLMPLPPNEPLDTVTIQAIQAWAAGGFPE